MILAEARGAVSTNLATSLVTNRARAVPEAKWSGAALKRASSGAGRWWSVLWQESEAVGGGGGGGGESSPAYPELGWV